MSKSNALHAFLLVALGGIFVLHLRQLAGQETPLEGYPFSLPEVIVLAAVTGFLCGWITRCSAALSRLLLDIWLWGHLFQGRSLLPLGGKDIPKTSRLLLRRGGGGRGFLSWFCC